MNQETRMKLDQDDITLLMESLDAHEKSFAMSRSMGMMLGAMLTRDREEFEREQKRQEERDRMEEMKHRSKREACALMKAKLIYLRRELDSEDAGRILTDARLP